MLDLGSSPISPILSHLITSYAILLLCDRDGATLFSTQTTCCISHILSCMLREVRGKVKEERKKERLYDWE